MLLFLGWRASIFTKNFCLPCENYEKKETTDIFEIMEQRLYNYIMRPAMLLSWIFGIILIYLNGLDVLSNLWMQIKAYISNYINRVSRISRKMPY